MAANLALKQSKRFTPYSDNNNDFGAILSQKEIHPLALEGVKRLISHHSMQTPIVIKSWGTANSVYIDIRQSLITFGYEIGMAKDIAEKLVEHAKSHSEASRAKYGANIIALKLEVSKQKPATQFETGALESQRIDGFSNQAQVAGATTVAVGFTTSGTTTTALRDSVGEIMNAMAGASQAVWIDFEAPDKSELQGISNNATLSAIAQIADGGLAPEKIAELLVEIQSLAEMGLLAPEMLNVLQNMQHIQTQAIEGNFDNIKELSQEIIKDLSTTLETGDISLDIISVAIELLQTISDTYGLKTVIDFKNLIILKQNLQTTQLIKKLSVIASTLEPVDRTTLEEFIEKLNKAEGAEVLSSLDIIQEHLESVSIESIGLSVLTAEINSLKELVTQNLLLDQKLEVLAKIGAQDLMDLLQELDGLNELPLELKNLLEQIDIENLTIEDLKEALAGNGEPALVRDLLNVAITLQNPEIQAALSQTTLNRVNQFLTVQSALVEAITTKAIVSELTVTIIDLDPSSAEAAQIQEVIDRLEAGESLDKINPSIIEAVADKLHQSASTKLRSIIQSINNVAIKNTTIGADTHIELTKLIQSGDLKTPLVSDLEQALEKGDLSTAIEVISQDSKTSEPLLTFLLQSQQKASSSPALKTEIAQLIAEIESNYSIINAHEIQFIIAKLVQSTPSSTIGPNIESGVTTSTIALAKHGEETVKNITSFSPTALTQQLSNIADSIIPTSTVKAAVIQQITAVTNTVKKLDTATPPTIKELVSAAQSINAIQKLTAATNTMPQATMAQLSAISQQIQSFIPVSVRTNIQPELKAFIPFSLSKTSSALNAVPSILKKETIISALNNRAPAVPQQAKLPAQPTKEKGAAPTAEKNANNVKSKKQNEPLSTNSENLKDATKLKEPTHKESIPTKTDTKKQRLPETTKREKNSPASSNKEIVKVTLETRAELKSKAIMDLGGTEVISFKNAFNNATTKTAKLEVAATRTLQSLVKSFSRTCGSTCSGCGACGQALQKVAATAFKPIQGMKTILGLKPSNQQVSNKFKVNGLKATAN